MKWSIEQVEQLKALALEGKSNREIAAILNVPLTSIHQKRSALGITRNKIQGLTLPRQWLKPEQAPPIITAGTEDQIKCSECACYNCFSTGSPNTMSRCPHFVSRTQRGLEFLRSCKHRFLMDISRGGEPVSRDEYQQIVKLLDQIIPEQTCEQRGA